MLGRLRITGWKKPCIVTSISIVTVAVFCARAAERGAPLGGARTAVGVYTVVAAVIILAATLYAWRRHRRGREPAPHEHDTPGDRHRFLGLAMLLLSILSLIALLYVASAALVLETCR